MRADYNRQEQCADGEAGIRKWAICCAARPQNSGPLWLHIAQWIAPNCSSTVDTDIPAANALLAADSFPEVGGWWLPSRDC